MTTICVGVSHKQAPIEVRERLAVPPDQLRDRLEELRRIPGVREALLVSTCNRMEIVAAADSREVAGDLLDTLDPIAAHVAVCRFDEDALRHLFRVASSLDSMVLGEAQILGQVKEAAAQAQAAGTLGPELQRVFSRAVGAAKRVRTETEIARGVVSLSSVAVEVAQKLLGDLRERSVLLLGAGEMSELAARELRAQGARELLVANRTASRAQQLAGEVGGMAVALSELPLLLERADVVICSTGSEQHLITRELVAQAIKARRFRPLFLVDLSLPRNVEPSANALEGVYVYDLDDLERVAAQNRTLREAQIGRAEAIIEEELEALLARTRERQTVPVLARLRAQGEALARAEAERTLSAALRGLDERQQKSVRAMASAIVNKLLHGPTARLRSEAGKGPLADAAAELFGFNEEPQPLAGAAVLPLVRNG
jgi:glutamyl-tRNA reductase